MVNKSMVKSLAVLECFSTVDRKLALSEIVQRTGFPRATAHRIITSLKEIGFIDQDKERDLYRLGFRLFELGSIVLSNMELHREAKPFIEALTRVSGESVTLTVFNGMQAVIINTSEPDRRDANPMMTLESVPAYCSASGKAALAFQPKQIIEQVISLGLTRFTPKTVIDADTLRAELDKIRQQGYAIDDEEHRFGTRCVAAPIGNASGRIFAAVSISCPTRRVTLERLEELSSLVIFHAASISAQLGFKQPSRVWSAQQNAAE